MSAHPALAQHRGLIAQASDFLQLVAYKQNAAAVPGQFAQRFEQCGHFLGCQYRSGFVQDQQGTFLNQAADNLHPLPLPHRQGADKAPGVQCHPIVFGHLPDTLLQCAPVANLICRQAQRNVFRHGQGFKQREVLKDHAYAQLPGPGRVLHCHRVAIPDNTTGIRLNHAIDDFHQRAFARAILPQQGVDLAGAHSKVYAVVSPASRVIFHDPLQL